MKRILLFGLVFALCLGLLAGCADAKEDTVATFEPVTETEPVVNTMDEFLAAIGSDRTVTLAAGKYNLSDASDYGRSGSSDCYRWENMGNGYQLVLTGVDNLTIRGAGMEETFLEAESRDTCVLSLEKCFRVTLEDFTAGHTQQPDYCSAGVVGLNGSMAVTLRRVGLYGCGTTGVDGWYSDDVQIVDCHIYDCSSSGVNLYRCDEVRIQNTAFTDIGNREEGGFAVFSLSQCWDTTISGCEITGANASWLLSFRNGVGLRVKNCRFTDNRVMATAFDLSMDSYPLLQDCMFDGNVIRRWYALDSWSSKTFVDERNNMLTEADLKKMYANIAPQEPLPEQTTVEAATVEELLSAIGSNTRIVLTGKTYDLSAAVDSDGENFCWQETGDGPELVIFGVDNMTIESADGLRANHSVTATPRYANVMRFEDCTNLRLAGFTAGHTPEPGYCSGGVLRFDNCDDITVENCGLYGCGVLGVWAMSCGDITVSGCEIYECSWGGISLDYVSGASIENCTFRDLEGDDIILYESDGVTVDGQDFFG